MRNRIRTILVLMSACILGVFVFQGYWIYNTYQVRLQDFSRDINDALRSALQHKQLSEAYRLLGRTMPATAVKGFTVARPRVVNFHATTRWSDTGQVAVTRVFETTNGKVHLKMVSADSIKRQFADSLSRDISDILMVNKFYNRGMSVQSFDSAFRRELAARNIGTPYRLDSLRFDTASAGTIEAQAGNPLQTFALPFNPFSDFAVRAQFSSPMRHILRQMLGTLVGSAALLLLTTGCFIYMLRTILQQKKLSEVKNDFINNMTHELKTPIATVSAAVEALQHFNALSDPQKTQTYLSISRQELQRLSDLVEKVLHIAAEEKEQFDLHYEETNINDLVSGIVANHRLKAGKNVDFSYTVLSDPLIPADRTHLGNAINNLVDNAIKYSGDPAVVNIHITRETGRMSIAVKDNGMGIPVNYQDSIFEKFFRVPNGNLHNVKGFGLGLSYVKKIAEMHGGGVRVKSAPDKGSEFILEIPLN